MIKNVALTVSLLLIFVLPSVQADENENIRIFSELKKMDDLLFEESFNQCHTDVLLPIITDDLEFYHDLGGYQNRAEFLKAMKENICSGRGDKIIRRLVPKSLKVYPLKNNGILYAAIQNGKHEFYTRTADNQLHKNGVARFTHLWILENKMWKLKRVLSFDHQPASIE